jgi:hypothetical protein
MMLVGPRGPSPLGQAGARGPLLLVGPLTHFGWLLVGPLLTLPLAADFWIRRRQTSRREFPIGTMRRGGPLGDLRSKRLGVRPPLQSPPGGPSVGASRPHTPLNALAVGGIPPSCLVSVCTIVVSARTKTGCRSREMGFSFGRD